MKDYLKKIKVKIVDESEDKMELEFDLINVEAPIANAIRRVLIAEVDTLVAFLFFLGSNDGY